MADKSLFSPASISSSATTRNQAGGRAYAFSPEHALAQLTATGTMNNTFYATGLDQLQTVIALSEKVSPLFLAKTAVYAREKGFMKDMPALLTALLSRKDPKLFSMVFPRTIDNGKMLRNFVQIVRSGATGRKSLGSAPKRAAQRWFQSRSPQTIFKQSLGSEPSMKDVIKLVRPSPKLADGQTDVMRQALYGYLIDKEHVSQDLPDIVQAFQAYKNGSGQLPDVSFEMLTALPLTTVEWSELAKRMSFTQLRMNLNTLLRHGVFTSAEMVAHVAQKLQDPGLVRISRTMPYQLMTAWKAQSAQMPKEIGLALQAAMEIATENVPAFEGRVYICPDVSGSMHSSVTGYRKGATSAVRCLDVAALIGAAILRRNPTAEVIPFSDDVVKLPHALNPLDSIATNAQLLAGLPSGGTACSAPLRALNQAHARGDLVIYVSDNMSWADFARSPSAASSGVGVGTRPTVMAEEWDLFSRRNLDAKLVLIDLQPYGSTQVSDRADVLNVGGFSDSVFDVVSLFAKGTLDAAHWVGAIESVSLS
jgi:60 kDa SS-A/Ro ribonucleoprotein